MRIRFYSYFYFPCIGGGEVILQHQAEELARRGHEVHVHTTPFTNMDGSSRVAAGTAFERGVTVHRRASIWLPGRNPLEKNAFTPTFFADAWLPADLLVCVGFPSFHLDALSVRHRLTGTPLVVQNYVTADFLAEILDSTQNLGKRVRARYWQQLTRRQLRSANVVLADSPAAAAGLSQRLGLTNVRTHIGMAVDPAEFSAISAADRSAVRKSLGLANKRLMLAPSRISRQKGTDLLVEAALRVLPGTAALGEGWKARGDWALVVCGPVNETEFANAVRERAQHHPSIVFTQLPRQELLALFAESDIVVLPSRGETVGGVVFEGMYAEALVIVSDAVEAAREDYLHHGQNGLMVPAEDVDALTAALALAMSDAYSPLRQNGKEVVETRFTWSASVDRLLELYPLA